MRSALLVLAVALASLHLVRTALARRLRRATLIPGEGRGRSAALDARELRLVARVAKGGGPARTGGKRLGRSAAPQGDAASSRFAEWRYYGFSNHETETDASVAEPSVVASSLAIGSVVTTLPDDCVNVVVNGGVYWQCGSVWYELQYTGSDVTYVVVRAL